MKTKLVAILGAVVVLLLASSLDYWEWTRRELASQAFISGDVYYISFWGAGFANLLSAGALLLLVWFVYTKAEKSWWVASLFILLGKLTAFFVVVYMALPPAYKRLPINVVPFLTYTSHLSMSGGFILLLGIAMLVAKIKRPKLAS